MSTRINFLTNEIMRTDTHFLNEREFSCFTFVVEKGQVKLGAR